jgi:uncharacterized protein YutE (UPF0331/DUF86 family)
LAAVDAEAEIGDIGQVSPIIDRLDHILRHVDHLRSLLPRVTGTDVLRSDFSLHNDVLFSLITICQFIIDIASELSARRHLRFQNYTEAVQNLSAYSEFPPALIQDLVKMPGFRNVVVHEYVTLDYNRVIAALNRLGSVEEFVRIVARMEAESEG